MTIEVNKSVGLNKSSHNKLPLKKYRFSDGVKKIIIRAFNFYEATEKSKQFGKLTAQF